MAAARKAQEKGESQYTHIHQGGMALWTMEKPDVRMSIRMMSDITLLAITISCE
jgi:hypothetical protein